jgi:hypothetical protein
MTKLPRPKRKFSIRLLARETFADGFSALSAGIKSLATPKGIVALFPIVVSLAAFVKTSYSTTNLVVLINGPIVMELISFDSKAANADDQEKHEDPPGSAQIRDFEMFMASDGPETIYVADIFLNIVIHRPNGTFNSNCVFESKEAHDIPFALNAEPLVKNYAYQLRSGFVVGGNTVLPLSSHLRNVDMGGLGSNTTDRVREILADNGESPIAFCIAATTFTAGSSRQRAVWQGNSSDKDFDASFIVRLKPVARDAGGEPTAEKRTRHLALQGRHFEHGINLYTSRRWTLF